MNILAGRDIVENFETTDGEVIDLQYIVCVEDALTFSDLALFKTRGAAKYIHQMELVLGPDYDEITLDNCLNQIEQKFPNIKYMIDRENQITENNTIRTSYTRPTISGTMVENYVPDMPCLVFIGRVVDIYRILISEYIYDMSFQITTRYFETLPPPPPIKRTMTRKEYNMYIKRRIARKKDESTLCTLSLENIKSGQTVATTCCGHQFKSAELRIWLTRECIKPTCPLCRTNLLETINI